MFFQTLLRHRKTGQSATLNHIIANKMLNIKFFVKY